ncbi:unnamed protein product [Arctia plantaginis]|uniref:Mitochondrial carnitine/acylcarnitine carrier protein n=1 Tax=Arctia plantaginis TaxID=874455 RepID=A0A8S0ZHZ0_ARCPL|nr:unnamed protein product [Arctia plantaginis]CAB3241393.1 unnamed protein product [Arctia plantaginis]
MSEKHSLYKYFFCGGLGRVFSITLGYPLDTVKVILQTMPVPKPGEPPLYSGMIDCIVKSIQKDGFKSLFRGMMAPLVISVPVNSILFLSFGLGKKLFEKDVDPSMPELFVAGAFSGTLTSFLVGPAERIKCLLQVRDDGTSTVKYRGTFDCFKLLYAQGGIRNVYKGTTATLLRDIPATGLFFMSYDSLMKITVSKDTCPSNKMAACMFAGGVSGMCYWIVAMPADLLKTRFQTAPEGKYSGLMDVFKQLMSREGPRGLFTGLTPVLVRAFPVNAVTFLGFEIGVKVYDWILPAL